MQNDTTPITTNISFDQATMNDRRECARTFAMEADVTFPAAIAESTSSRLKSEADLIAPLRQEENANVPETGFTQDSQACSVTRVNAKNAERDSRMDTSRLETLELGRGQTVAIDRNGMMEKTKSAAIQVSFSLGPVGETKDETRRSSSSHEVVSGGCQIRNANSIEAQGSSVRPSHLVAMGTQRDLGCLIDTCYKADTPAHNPTHGREGLESAEIGSSHGNGVRKTLAMQEEPDLVIEVGGQKIQAHKSVLAEKSDYFKARQSRDILMVKGVNYKTLSILVDYVYTSRMNVHKDNIVEVIKGAKILQIPCAVQAAIDTMSAQITFENCYEILSIAKRQRLNELKDTAYRFMSDNFLQVLRDPAVYGRLTGLERDLILKTRMDGQKSLMAAEINDVFDRVGSRPQSRNSSRPQSPLSLTSLEESHMIYYFMEPANEWRTLTSMPEEINTKGCGICSMYNYLFVAGGIKGYGDKGKVSDKVFCYNPVSNSWSEIRPMLQARSQLKLVSMDGYLYAIGGECLFTVEKYDPRMDRWTNVAPLPKGAFAVAHEATTCSGELYVSGGSLFYRLLRYDAKRDEWQECPYNNSRKKSTDMVAFKNFIYRFDVNRDQGVNVFKYNSIVKMWHDSASLPQSNPLPFRCAVIGNCIYCVNKSQTLQFIVEEDNARFVQEPLKAPFEVKGVLFPFVLSLPEKH